MNASNAPLVFVICGRLTELQVDDQMIVNFRDGKIGFVRNAVELSIVSRETGAVEKAFAYEPSPDRRELVILFEFIKLFTGLNVEVQKRLEDRMVVRFIESTRVH